MRYLSFFFLIISFSLSAQSQLMNSNTSQRIVKGKVVNKETGKPEVVEIIFKDQDGKKFKINSNSITGEYEQLLNAEQSYIVSFSRFDVYNEEFELKVEKADEKFTPQVKNFEITILEAGKALFSWDAFEPGSSTVGPKVNEMIDKLKTTLRFNRSITVEVQLNGNDSGNSNGVAKARLDALNKILESDRRLKRKTKFVLGNGNANADFVVMITKVEDQLK